MIVLPRQARDRHRENSPNKTICAGALLAGVDEMGLDESTVYMHSYICETKTGLCFLVMLCYKSSVCQDRLGTDIGKPFFFEIKRERDRFLRCGFSHPTTERLSVRNTPLLSQLYTQNHLFTKTGSGQTWKQRKKLRKRVFSAGNDNHGNGPLRDGKFTTWEVRKRGL
jgi:hypothetical protein